MKRYVEWVIGHRMAVIAATLLITIAAVLQARNLEIVIDPNTLMPQSHPYVSTSNEVERVFGSKHVVVVGVTPKEGDIYQPAVLEKVQNITAAFLQVPGVVKENIMSLSARRAKDIVGTAEGLQVRPLMSEVPKTAAQMAALKASIERNPVYVDTIVSRDSKTAAVIVEFRASGAGGFRSIMDKVSPIVEQAKDDRVDISIGGLPTFLAQLEIYAERMGILLPIAIVILCLVLFGAFRTVQGLFLPLVTALLAVSWGVGVMGASGIPMDAFNATTPILILAVATGHAVQMLKRYYEEYYRLRESTDLPPQAANDKAIVSALMRVGPVMIAAGVVASLGFFSLVVFEITSVRTFGIFTGVGVLAALALEMTFIPALRSLLSPPNNEDRQRDRQGKGWDRVTTKIAAWSTGRARPRVFGVLAIIVILSLVGVTRITEDNSVKRYFSPDLPFQHDDRLLNARLGGTNTLYLLVDSDTPDTIKDPSVLKAMESLQSSLEKQPLVGKTMSIVDLVKRMNKAMHGDQLAYNKIPATQELVSQYLLLYSMSGEPGDFDSYVDYDYRQAKLTAYLKTDSTAYMEDLAKKIEGFAAANFPASVRVRIGGSVPQDAALNQAMVDGKILNIAQISAVVFVISSLIFRSFSAGLVVLLPLSVAVLSNFGLMGWTGIPLNIPTALTSAMAVGIGADYAIYLIYRLREEIAAGTDEVTSIRNAITTAGKAILFVAIAVAAGYGVLLLSFGFYIHIWMSILIALAMIVSAITALLLIPAIVLTLRPRFVFGKTNFTMTVRDASAMGIAVAVALYAVPHRALAADPDLVPVMEKNFAVSKVGDSVSDATFTLINKSGQTRVRKVFVTTKLAENNIDNMRMTRFLSPPDVKGTASLLIEHSAKDDDMWIYLPALKKVRRLVSSNKKDGFVGTDFSYGDVIGHKVDDWKYKLLREEAVDGHPCYVIEAVPASDAIKSNTGYSKRVTWIRKDNNVSAKTEFWDEAGQPLKTAVFSDIRLVDSQRDKWQPMRLEANNVQTGHRTVIQLDSFRVNQNVKSAFFTTRYLEKY